MIKPKEEELPQKEIGKEKEEPIKKAIEDPTIKRKEVKPSIKEIKKETEEQKEPEKEEKEPFIERDIKERTKEEEEKPIERKEIESIIALKKKEKNQKRKNKNQKKKKKLKKNQKLLKNMYLYINSWKNQLLLKMIHL